MRRAVEKLRKLSKTRFLRGLALGSLGFCTASAVDTHGTGPEWLEVVELDLPIEHLGKNFIGKRIVHISDLHCSTTVTTAYLRRCVARINELEPDLIVITGDFVTYDARGRFKAKIIELLAHLKSDMGIYACLGNHDYSFTESRRYTVAQLSAGLEQSGLKILRNESQAISIGRERLYLVGLGDTWSGDCLPQQAFADVPRNAAVLTLVHNPDAIEYLQHSRASVVLCGHTHGARHAAPAKRPRGVFSGMFRVNGQTLYINRGLGRHGRPRLRCRPEITVFTLT